MVLSPQAAYYVVRFYSYLMTDVELKAQRHLFAAMKATKGRSDVGAQRKAQEHKIYSRLVSDEKDVLSLAKDGYEEFEARTAARLLRTFADKVFFNYCPVCGGLARTPTAKQCRSCGHDWHGS